MNKHLNRFFLFLLLPSLVSCKPGGTSRRLHQGEYTYLTYSTSPITSTSGKVRVESSSSLSVDPFNTSILANLYYYKNDYSASELKALGEEINDFFQYASALSDRHYYYDQVKEDGTAQRIVNLKVLNDAYGSEKPVTLDPFLYGLLKDSYSFSLASGGKFNCFLGTLSQFYEDKLSQVSEGSESLLDNLLSSLTGRTFASFTSEEKSRIASLVSSLPKTKEDMEGLLSFDDSTSSVVFHRFKDVDHLEISLGGNAKGYATEQLCDKLPSEWDEDLSLLVNSGSSSIKTIGKRPDNKPWSITYNNPVYYEGKGQVKANRWEVLLSYEGNFNLSTSGYYEQYFYAQNGAGKDFDRFDHIVDAATGYSVPFFDAVSVYLDNAGLADMYTTALMNCSSLKEATDLFLRLNETYGEKDSGLILTTKSEKGNKDALKHYSYQDFDVLNESGYPEVRLADGNLYQGDYSDLKGTDIASLVSLFSPSYQENYYFTKNLYANARKGTESDGLSQENASVLWSLGI